MSREMSREMPTNIVNQVTLNIPVRNISKAYCVKAKVRAFFFSKRCFLRSICKKGLFLSVLYINLLSLYSKAF